MVAVSKKVVKLQVLVVPEHRSLRASAQDALCIKILINYFINITLPILPIVRVAGTCWMQDMVPQRTSGVQLIKVKNLKMYMYDNQI